MTPGEAATINAICAAVWASSTTTASNLAAREEFIADLDFATTRAAIGKLACTLKFMPSIAEIRAAVADQTLGEARRGLQAWGDVAQAIRRVGYIGQPTFEDPLVAECVRLMGWMSLCKGDAPDGVDRAHFAKLYDELSERQRARDVSEPGRLMPGQEPAQLPARVRELTEGFGDRRAQEIRHGLRQPNSIDHVTASDEEHHRTIGAKPLQPSHGKTGTEKARRL